MNIKDTFKFFISIALLNTPIFSHATELVLSVDENTNIINIDPHGSTASQILVALEKQMGFELSGKLEAEAIAINHPLQGNTQQLIEQLAKPQSIMMLLSSDKNGNKIISKVELLPTGKTDSKFLNDGTMFGYKRPPEAADKEERRLARQKRNSERKANGTANQN